MSKGTAKNNNWGSHNRLSHSVLKSVPKMENKHRVKKVFNKGTDYETAVVTIEGYGSVSRSMIKKMHKKKRRQTFKKETMYF